jgi:hypothetical protein
MPCARIGCGERAVEFVAGEENEVHYRKAVG